MAWVNNKQVLNKIIWLWGKTVTHWEGFDGPLHSTLLRDPFGLACAGLKFGWVSVTRHGHQDNHVVGSGAAFELATGLEDTEHHAEVNIEHLQHQQSLT